MKLNYKKGFTLIELLVVIAIIGILASVVMTSLSSARTKASRAAAIATLSGVIPELITCGDDGGYANTAGAGTVASPTVAVPTAAGVPTAGAAICVNSAGAVLAGHTAAWPAFQSGTAYAASAGGAASLNTSPSTLVLNATVTGATAIACTLSTGSCQ